MKPKNTALIPEKYRILSGSMLKLIALITMILDHVTHILLEPMDFANQPLFSGAPESLTLYQLGRLIGRTAFPIYCFLITEGYRYTHSRRKYGLNLLIFALISEIPWNLEHTGTLRFEKQNVFFTLLLGYWCICVYEHFQKNKRAMLLSLLGLTAASVILHADYGYGGMGFILLLYVLREQRILQALLGTFMLSSAWKTLPAFLLINLYSGKRGFIHGKLSKYLFYIIYPLHMLILYAVRLHTSGY